MEMERFEVEWVDRMRIISLFILVSIFFYSLAKQFHCMCWAYVMFLYLFVHNPEFYERLYTNRHSMHTWYKITEFLANVKFRDEILSIRKYIVNQMKNSNSDKMARCYNDDDDEKKHMPKKRRRNVKCNNIHIQATFKLILCENFRQIVKLFIKF